QGTRRRRAGHRLPGSIRHGTAGDRRAIRRRPRDRAGRGDRARGGRARPASARRHTGGAAVRPDPGGVHGCRRAGVGEQALAVGPPGAPAGRAAQRHTGPISRVTRRVVGSAERGSDACEGAMDSQQLQKWDAAHVWHPYGPMPGTVAPLVVESARGVRLQLADGRELIDGMSSWWAAIHGYRHPRLDAAVVDQVSRMSHVMFGGLTHEPAVRLARTLVELTPDGLEHVFLCDSGSVSVEVAMKMCLQYWRSVGRPGKQRMLTWRGGYHGDTFHPMSVCDPEGGMHALWRGVLPEQVFVPAPPSGYDDPVDQDY